MVRKVANSRTDRANPIRRTSAPLLTFNYEDVTVADTSQEIGEIAPPPGCMLVGLEVKVTGAFDLGGTFLVVRVFSALHESALCSILLHQEGTFPSLFASVNLDLAGLLHEELNGDPFAVGVFAADDATNVDTRENQGSCEIWGLYIDATLPAQPRFFRAYTSEDGSLVYLESSGGDLDSVGGEPDGLFGIGGPGVGTYDGIDGTNGNVIALAMDPVVSEGDGNIYIDYFGEVENFITSGGRRMQNASELPVENRRPFPRWISTLGTEIYVGIGSQYERLALQDPGQWTITGSASVVTGGHSAENDMHLTLTIDTPLLEGELGVATLGFSEGKDVIVSQGSRTLKAFSGKVIEAD
jgi:hypothetical protein